MVSSLPVVKHATHTTRIGVCERHFFFFFARTRTHILAAGQQTMYIYTGLDRGFGGACTTYTCCLHRAVRGDVPLWCHQLHRINWPVGCMYVGRTNSSGEYFLRFAA